MIVVILKQMIFQEVTESARRLLVLIGFSYVPVRMIFEILNIFCINGNSFKKVESENMRPLYLYLIRVFCFALLAIAYGLGAWTFYKRLNTNFSLMCLFSSSC